MAEWQRTHTCGELREAHIGQTVTLTGWVNTYRAQQYQVFLDLRDRHGLTQVVFESSDADAELFASAGQVRSEWVLSVTGTVRARLPGKENAKLATGKVEILGATLRVLNECPTLPFEVFSFPQEDGTLADPPQLANEDLRLEHRFLDLRRAPLQRTLALRHRLNKVIRDFLDQEGFLELETPLLGRSTPEGARDYLVPSRIFTGSFYALPQSPQLYKQLLMVAGYDRYFQIARCLRDEDLRADRQPEFTQLDIEMSFVEMDDVLKLTERLVVAIFERCIGVKLTAPFPRLSYADVMLRYGSDKPDLRFGLEISDVSDLFAETELGPFKEALKAGGRVRAVNVTGGAAAYTRKHFDEANENFKGAGGRLLAWVKLEADGKVGSSIAKFLSPEVQAVLVERLGAKAGDLLLLGAGDSEDKTASAMGQIRLQAAAKLNLVDPAKREFKVAWVLDFPSFIWDEEEGRWAANHHPFTAPRDEHVALLETNPRAVLAKAYDLVINGYETAGGSIRIHNRAVQSALFNVLGIDEVQAQERFGFLLNALQYGAPPHGGIAFGLDRFAMLLAGTTNIRDVIAFPKNQRARDLMTGAPAPVDERQLKDLGIQLPPEKPLV